MSSFIVNERVERTGWAQAPGRDALQVHRRLPGYEPTPLRSWGPLLLKDESDRLTLPAFKILGSSWAVYRELVRRLGEDRLEPWRDIVELRARVHGCGLGGLKLVTASDGNHGRGVARVGKWLGLPATVFMPRVTVPARVEAIRAEGAEVEIVDGSYDESVCRAAAHAAPRELALLVQDTSWEGYETIPARVIEGYSTLLWEIDDQLAARSERAPDVVIVPVGVGSLAAAVVRHFRRPGLASYPRIVGVEARGSECAYASIQTGRRITVPEGPPTIMAGLNCGTLATLAWPVLQRGMDAVVVLADAWAARAVRQLHGLGVESGESGAAGVGAWLALEHDPVLGPLRRALATGPETRVLAFSTEGVTDPETREQLLSRDI